MSKDLVIGMLVGALIVVLGVIVVGSFIPAETVGPVASSWSATPVP